MMPVDNSGNLFQWSFRNFVIVIERYVTDWIVEYFSNYHALCKYMHDLFMHCRNHHSDSHTNHVIIRCYWFDRCYNYDMIHHIGHVVDNDIKGNNIEMNTSRCNMLHNTSETIYCTEALTINGNQLQAVGTVGVTMGVSEQIGHFLVHRKPQIKPIWDQEWNMFYDIQYMATNISILVMHVRKTCTFKLLVPDILLTLFLLEM